MITAEQIIEMNTNSFNNPEELKKLAGGLDRTEYKKPEEMLEEIEDPDLAKDLRWLGILMYDSVRETF